MKFATITNSIRNGASIMAKWGAASARLTRRISFRAFRARWGNFWQALGYYLDDIFIGGGQYAPAYSGNSGDFNFSDFKPSENWKPQDSVLLIAGATALTGVATAKYASLHLASFAHSGAQIAAMMHVGAAVSFAAAFAPYLAAAALGVGCYVAFKTLRHPASEEAQWVKAGMRKAANIKINVPDPYQVLKQGIFGTATWFSKAQNWQKGMALGGVMACSTALMPGMYGAADMGSIPTLPVKIEQANLMTHPMAAPTIKKAEAKAPAAAAATFAAPFAAGTKWRISSHYGFRRNPFTHSYGDFHPGIDIAAKRGTPIHNVISGTVVYAGRFHGYGNMVAVAFDTPQGERVEKYGHMRRISSKLKIGYPVDAGTVLGWVGKTGYATGYHLHYEVDNPHIYKARSRYGRSVNPMSLEPVRAAFTAMRENRNAAPQPTMS